MLFSNNRSDLRRMVVDAWARHRAGTPLEPLQAQIVDVVADHPEYHGLLEDDTALDRDWTPDEGQLNPFLHLALHLAVREQCATDRPRGIRAVRDALARRQGDLHAAEHTMIDVLGEALWEAQRSGQPPDETRYLETLRRFSDA